MQFDDLINIELHCH